MALAHVLDVQERELAANRAALQLMKDAIEAKKSTGIPVLPETYEAVAQLERQTDLLAEDIDKRRAELRETRTIAERAEAKVDDLAKFAKKAHPELDKEVPNDE